LQKPPPRTAIELLVSHPEGLQGFLKARSVPLPYPPGVWVSWVIPPRETIWVISRRMLRHLPLIPICQASTMELPCFRSPPAQSAAFGSTERGTAFPHPGPASRSDARRDARSAGSPSTATGPGCDATRTSDRTGACSRGRAGSTGSRLMVGDPAEAEKDRMGKALPKGHPIQSQASFQLLKEMLRLTPLIVPC